MPHFDALAMPQFPQFFSGEGATDPCVVGIIADSRLRGNRGVRVPAKFKYSREDATARYALSLLRIHAQSDTLERLHRAVEREIRAASRAIQRATRNEDLVEAIMGDEILTIEELLGLAFVAAQSFITLIRTELIAVNNVHLRYLKSPLSFAGSNGYDALKLAPMLPAANCSEVEAINAVANYWKHSEEWPVSEAKSGTQVREVWVNPINTQRSQSRR